MNRVYYFWFLFLASICCLGTVLLLFCPPFDQWRGLTLEYPVWSRMPATSRAADTLRQVDNPWIEIDNSSNKVIRWRLLFPLLAHYLHLPKVVFLALPQIGCVLVFLMLLHLLASRTNDWPLAIMGVTLLTTSSWFFVSTGWLAYFDSWFVLGLLTVAFTRSRCLLTAACLLTPWVDERFILALPLTWFVRAIYFRLFLRLDRRVYTLDGLLCLLFMLPYIGLRLLMIWRGGDADSTAHLQTSFSFRFPFSSYVEGIWSGFRAAWLFVVLAMWAVWYRQGKWLGALLFLGICGTLLINISLAGDWSRATSSLLPVVVLGILTQHQQSSNGMRRLVGLLLFVNLLMPVEHVITVYKIPIRWLGKVLADWHDPPWPLRPQSLAQEGADWFHNGQLKWAQEATDAAIQLDPTQPEFFDLRGEILTAQGQITDALKDFDHAIEMKPNFGIAYYHRGLAHAANNHRVEAIRDFTTALKSLPESPTRRIVEQSLSELTEAKR